MLLGIKFLGREERGFQRAIHTSHWLPFLTHLPQYSWHHSFFYCNVTDAFHAVKELHCWSGIASDLLLFVRHFVHFRTI